MLYCPRSSVSRPVFNLLVLFLDQFRPVKRRLGGRHPLMLEQRVDAVCAVVMDGLSYRRVAKTVGISKTEVGVSLRRLLPAIASIGFCQPDGTFVTTLNDLTTVLTEMTAYSEPVSVDGFATRVPRPASWFNQKPLYDVKRSAHTAQGFAICNSSGDLLWVDGGWPGSTPEPHMLTYSGVDTVLTNTGVLTLADRGFRSTAKRIPNVRVPTGDKRNKEKLAPEEHEYNSALSAVRALSEQTIAHLTNTSWALRRWRGKYVFTQALFRAGGVISALTRWHHRIPQN